MAAFSRKGVLDMEGVRICPSKPFKCFLKEFVEETTRDESLRRRLKGILEKTPVLLPLDVVKAVREVLRQSSSSFPLHELLEGSELRLPSPVTPPRNLELEIRVQKLRAQQMNREYEQMVSDVDLSRRSNAMCEVRSDFRDAKKQCIALVNLLVTLGGTFAFFYKAVEYSLPVPHIPAQVFAGLLASIVVAIAELYFIVKVI